MGICRNHSLKDGGPGDLKERNLREWSKEKNMGLDKGAGVFGFLLFAIALEYMGYYGEWVQIDGVLHILLYIHWGAKPSFS